MPALADGLEPAAARNAEAYTRRSGSWIGSAAARFEDVMLERSGDSAGHVKGVRA